MIKSFLLIEGTDTIECNIRDILNDRFPNASLDHLTPDNVVPDWKSIPWNNYDLVIIDCPHALKVNIQQLEYIKQSPNAPIVFVLTRERDIGELSLKHGADDYYLHGDTISALAVKIDILQELRRYQNKHPLTLKEYRLTEVIHHCETSLIYLATDTSGKKVAIKQFTYPVSNENQEKIENYLQKLMQISDIHHPGLVDIYEAGISNNTIYLVMEYISGTTLKDTLDFSEHLQLPQAMEWFAEILDALSRIHRMGFVHRDLKTSNILVRKDKSLALVDYGLEDQLLIEANFISEDEIYCTPFYVSPERIAGQVSTPQSDIYSLGIIFYELLVGEKPFRASSIMDLITLHCNSPIPTFPEELTHYQTLLEKLLAKSPKDRLDSVENVFVELEKCA